MQFELNGGRGMARLRFRLQKDGEFQIIYFAAPSRNVYVQLRA